SVEEYIEQAVFLASQPEELAAIKQELRRQRTTCPLFDAQGYTRCLEAAYRQMWRQFSHGKQPTSFQVDEP
ncbi:MAG: UDP-N-acetylglucosamine-peptide N-acetylglucosaminyltransferase, partial [Gammaproteobacteria bacterium]|nr:UDP-N-acetylglucosamine-peptide N-acetylglucosaminyltransferase [Gammaproteobacteria bacterium]